MSDLRTSIISEVTARPQPPASKGKTNGGEKLPPEAGKEVEVGLQSKKEVVSQDRNDAVKEEVKVDSRQVRDAVTQMQDYMQNMERSLNFQLDEESGITVIKVYDSETEELIRQIPNEEVVSLAQKLNEEEPLMLFSAKV